MHGFKYLMNHTTLYMCTHTYDMVQARGGTIKVDNCDF